ncbi:MAG: hypothetical protein ACRCWQ_11145, partial [Bacilli bacterium]
PVVARGELIGIVTTSDLLRRLVSLTCSPIPSTRIDVLGPKTNDAVLTLIQTIADYKIPLISFIITEDETNSEQQIYVLRIRSMDTHSITQTLQEKGFDILCPF